MISALRVRAILASIAVTLVTIVGIATPANAASVSGNNSVSCNATSLQYINWVNQNPSGPMTFWSNSTSPTSTTRVTAESHAGNWLPTRLVSSGTYGAWSSVSVGVYDFYVRRNSATDCNGPLPGNGTYSLNWTIVYQ